VLRKPFPIEDLWKEVDFTPNPHQEAAIRQVDDHLFLATFTEKAAAKLKEGFLSYLALETNRTGSCLMRYNQP